MALVYKDRVKQVCTAPTTTNPFDFTGAATSTGYQTFVAALADGETCVYAAEDADGDWEVGIGTWTEASDQLARTTILASSNSGSAETFSGDTTVYITNSAKFMGVANRLVNRVVFSIDGSSGADQSAAVNTFVKCTTVWSSSAIIDTISGWDSTNDRYTPSLAGKYLFLAQVKFLSLGSSQIAIGRITKNGTAIDEGGRSYNSGSGTDVESGLVTSIADMNGSTDYVEVEALCTDSSGTKNIASDPATYLKAIYLGE